MPIAFTCSCGSKHEVADTEAGGETYCPGCKKFISVPRAESSAVKPASDAARAKAEIPPHCEMVRAADGKEYWKLTCFCGKRVRSPASIDQPVGRCPKCGRRMKLPGYLMSKKAFLISASPGQGPLAAPSKETAPPESAAKGPIRISELFENRAEEHTTPIAPIRALSGFPADVPPFPSSDDTIPLLSEDENEAGEAVVHRVSRTAAATAADRLRPQRAEDEGDGYGRISAWPLAGKASRALAAFIDLTLALIVCGIVVVLAREDVLPAFFLSVQALLAVLMLAGCANEALVHLLLGDSPGKKLVVIVTRTVHGARLGAGRILLRALLKWMLLPGWVLGAIDPNERCLHDLICGTLVLKGRAKR
ncbi:MAG TPA: RDD family protein [Planctomycetota bacterium]|nr:RDD family protein [Planctomycetota bacterium]